jgi:plasmid stabilization system protein ParE
MSDRGAWSSLLFTSVGHYGEQRLGMSRTAAEDRARLARSLRRLPVLRVAYESGEVGIEAATLVRRVLGRGPVEEGVEAAWVERARQATVKRLRDEARMLSSHPGAVPMEDEEWHGGLLRRPGDFR